MSRKKIPIRNRKDLALERRLAPFIETCAAFLVGNGNLHKMSRHPAADVPQGDWIVMKDSTGAGFSVWARIEGSSTTPMQNSLNRVHTLRSIARACRSTNEVPLILVDDLTPPQEWAFFRVSTIRGAVWCALSEVPPSGMPAIQQSETIPLLHVRVFGDAYTEVTPKVGVQIRVSSLTVKIPEFYMEGRLMFDEEKGMAIEISSSEVAQENTLPAVRIDLGELEISLGDVVGLRAGSIVKLGPSAPLRCFLRIGSSVLAEGEFRSLQDGAVIEITKVL